MAFDDGPDDESPAYRPPLPPDDRVWRHPSEVAAARAPRGISGTRLWLLALGSGLCGAVLATGVSVVAVRRDRIVERVVEAPPPVDARPVSLGEVDAVAVAEKVRPAIVEVRVDGAGGPTQVSGVIFRDDGHVLTNQHAVEAGGRLRVVLSDGREVAASVRGTDVDTDVAVLRLEGGSYPAATLGRAEAVKPGQPAIAVGSAVGVAGGASVSVGVISGVGRTLDRPSPLPDLFDMLQTDAAIARGSSGGALLDASGTVIGITTVVGDAPNPMVGFAVPIAVARAVADELIATGRVVRPWLGVEGADLDPETAARMALPGGARVAAVAGGGPAADAGLAAGDVIVAMDGIPVRSISALVVSLRAHRIGDRVRLTYHRGDDRREAEVTLAPRP